MKNVLTILFILVCSILFSQSKTDEWIKTYTHKGDSFYSAKNYSKAQVEYTSAYSFDRKNKYAKTRMDSCHYFNLKKLTDENYAKEQNRLIKQVKDKGCELYFDNNDKPVSYKNHNGELKIINDSLPSGQELKKIEKAYWVKYK